MIQDRPVLCVSLIFASVLLCTAYSVQVPTSIAAKEVD